MLQKSSIKYDLMDKQAYKNGFILIKTGNSRMVCINSIDAVVLLTVTLINQILNITGFREGYCGN